MEKLTELLADPVDPNQGLRKADRELLERINAMIAKGELKERSGTVLTKPIDDALINDSNTRIYPVENGIPILLIERGIEIEVPGN